METQTDTAPRTSLGDRARDLTAQAQQKAEDQVRTGVDSGRQRAAGALHGVADSLLNGSGEAAAGASRYIRQAGERVQRAADWLEHADVTEITERTEAFARRQPVLFIGGAFALGLIAARVLKGSRRMADDHESDQGRASLGHDPMVTGTTSAPPIFGDRPEPHTPFDEVPRDR